MNIIRNILLIVIPVSAIQELKSQDAFISSADRSRQEIEAINNNIGRLYITENIDTLISLYAEPLVVSPEYKPALLEINALKKFFTDWFKTADIKAYNKRIHSVEVYSGYVLEMGTFRLEYTITGKRQKEYEGHYMILWKRNGSGHLNIVSETFGANRYLEPEDVPYAGVPLEQSKFTPEHAVSQQVYADVIEFDAVVLKAVAEGDGDARANGFTEDAVLMSNFDSICVGMEVIRPKMLKTYTRDVSFDVKHTYCRIYDLGEYVFVNSHYKGGWGDTVNGGQFEGSMSNLMKRDKNGKLLMHRQAVNRDR